MDYEKKYPHANIFRRTRSAHLRRHKGALSVNPSRRAGIVDTRRETEYWSHRTVGPAYVRDENRIEATVAAVHSRAQRSDNLCFLLYFKTRQFQHRARVSTPTFPYDNKTY